MRTPEELARTIDHALLHPALSRRDLDEGLALSRDLTLWSVCVKPCDVTRATDYLVGSTTAVCAVIAFPHGNAVTDIKVQEALRAIDDGATEIDTVINVSAAIAGELVAIRDEMQALNQAVQSRGALLKVIFENAYLDDETKIALCKIAKELAVAFVKTSTGFASGFTPPTTPGATIHDVQLMVRESGPRCRVKASGGIRDLEAMEQFLDAGATRIGTSASRTIIEEARRRSDGSRF